MENYSLANITPNKNYSMGTLVSKITWSVIYLLFCVIQNDDYGIANVKNREFSDTSSKLVDIKALN
jgi:hypothetical protein